MHVEFIMPVIDLGEDSSTIIRNLDVGLIIIDCDVQFHGLRYAPAFRSCSLRRSGMFIDRTATEFLSSFRSVIFVALLKELSKELFVAQFYK